MSQTEIDRMACRVDIGPAGTPSCQALECRRATLDDLPRLRAMQNKRTTHLFGEQDVATLFEECVLTVVATAAPGGAGAPVAAVFLSDRPNVPALAPAEWPAWARRLYRLADCDGRNTAFVRLAACAPRRERAFFAPAARFAFAALAWLRYVVAVAPPRRSFLDLLGPGGTVVRPFGVEARDPQVLVMYMRHDFVPTYKFRKAVAEDNDDLVPLLDERSKRLKRWYGEFYVAEINLDRGPRRRRHMVVAERLGAAAAAILFDDRVNVDLLAAYFQLECFYGLRKYTERDETSCGGASSEYPSATVTCRSSLDASASSSSVGRAPCGAASGGSVDDLPAAAAVLEALGDVSLPRLSAEAVTAAIMIASAQSLTAVDEDGAATAAGARARAYRGVADFQFSIVPLTFDRRTLGQLRRRDTRPSCEKPPLPPPEPPPPPVKSAYRYRGRINAFAVELIAASAYDEQALPELLQAGFELFPDRDYCVLAVPGTVPAFDLLTKVFVRVTPQPSSNFPHELYVVHRNAVLGTVWIRPATEADQAPVFQLLHTMRNTSDIYRTFCSYLQSPTYSAQAFVILCENDIVGMANVRDVDNLAYVAARYQLSRLVDAARCAPGAVGRVRNFVLSPVFARHARRLLLELHRLADYPVLLCYVCPEGAAGGGGLFRRDPVACALGELVPVPPSRVPDYPPVDARATGWDVPEVLREVERPYAVYLSTPRYLGARRQEINTKIVVVGASEVGLSFLIHLIHHRAAETHTIFNNVTLVSTHGLPQHPTRASRWLDIFLPTTSEIINSYYLSMISLTTHVNVIRGVMTAIDRDKRTITVGSNTLLSYEMLFLTCGTQFQLPTPRPRPPDDPAAPSPPLGAECPENAFALNTEDDVVRFLARLAHLAGCRAATKAGGGGAAGSYVVHGNGVEAYCCLEALLEYGVEPADVVFALSPIDDAALAPLSFCDANFEEAVQGRLADAGVTVHRNCRFVDWTFDRDGVKVKRALFETPTARLEVDVKAIFFYQTKAVSRRTFLAIAGANLTFDGALVVDADFRTNDPRIYAAGRMTKYPRRYYADHMRHCYFNQTEIGKHMADSILARLLDSPPERDPDMFEECNDVRGKTLVPRYRKPVFLHAKIPRKTEYLFVRKPGVFVPMDVRVLDDDCGTLLVTGDYKRYLETDSYFLIHLNQYNAVETIVATTRVGAIELTNLLKIWGKHATLLNDLLVRYELGMISDLFQFFSEPWTYAIYHDRFEELERDLKGVLMREAEREPDASPVEDVVAKIKENEFRTLTSIQNNEIMEKFTESKYEEEMEKMVIKFLNDNYKELPMYASPKVMSTLLSPTPTDSPLFTNQ